MFSKIWTKNSTENCSAQTGQIERLKDVLEEADAIVIGAGAGLSTSAGFVYSGKRFEQYFSDFAKEYGFTDMYSGGFYPYQTLEEHWAYWSRYIWINRYQNAPKPVYEELFQMVKDKDYFVLTIASRKPGLRKSVCSTRREITGCFSAPNHAVRKTVTMNPCFARC